MSRINKVKNRGGKVLGTLGAVALTLTGCSGSPSSALENDRPEIAFLVPMNQDHPYGKSYVDNLEEAAEDRGVDLLVLNSRYDAAVQASQMKIAIARDVDGIVLWPGTYGTEEPMLVQAERAGIPVAISNSYPPDNLDNDLFTGFTGPDDHRIGSLQAEELNDLLDGEGSYVYIGGSPGNAAAVNRELGFKEGMEQYPGIEELGSQPGDFDQNKSQTAASSLISRFGDDIDAIVTPDDIAAAGAAQAVRAAGMQGEVALLGHNFAPVGKNLIENGEMSVTLFQSPCWDSHQALDSVLDVLQGEDVPDEQFMPLPVVTEENIDEFEPYGCIPEEYLEKQES